MFTTPTLVVGPMLPGQSQTLEYPYHGIVVKSLHPSCGCSDVNDDKVRGRVTAKYTAQDIPIHLMDKGGYVVEKTIKVKYFVEGADVNDINNLQELTLTFKATVTNGKIR